MITIEFTPESKSLKVRHPLVGDNGHLLHHAGSRLAGHTGQGNTSLPQSHIYTVYYTVYYTGVNIHFKMNIHLCSLSYTPPPTNVLLVQVPFCTSHGDLIDTHNLPGFDDLKGKSVQVL